MATEQGYRVRTRQIIRSFEARALRKRPFIVKIADRLTGYFGSLNFLLLNLILFIAWLTINTGRLPSVPIFDPYPFILLTMIVSLEAIFLTVIVLLSQNRQSLVSSLREEFDLQVNLMAERELTKALRLLSDIHKHLGIKAQSDAELDAMLKDLDMSYIERTLENQMKDEKKLLPTIVPSVVTKPLNKLTQTLENTLIPPINPK